MGVFKSFCLLMTLFTIALATAYHGYAETFQTSSYQRANPYGETVAVPEPVKQHYISRGQEYLRGYLRDQMLHAVERYWQTSNWLYMDWKGQQAGVGVNMTPVTASNGNQHVFFPLESSFRIHADEDLNRYMECGRFLPVEIEVNSALTINESIKVNAKLEAPFDDFIRIHFGSEINWSSVFQSRIQYSLANRQEVYDGLNLGMGVNLDHWYLSFNYDVSSDYVQLQYLSLARRF